MLQPVIEIVWHDEPFIIHPGEVWTCEHLAGCETVDDVRVDAALVRTAEPVKYWHLHIEREHYSAWMKVTIHCLANEPVHVSRIIVTGRRL